MSEPLSPTQRTRVTRHPERAAQERKELLAFLDEGLVAHLGVVVGDHPVVMPVAYAVDPDGPDEDGTFYVHGSVAAGWMVAAGDATVCLTVTSVDGLVLARSSFNHSMNYRSAVVIGKARLVQDKDERLHALDLVVEHTVPGRAATLRASTRRELAATAALAVSLHEASLKRRTGDPVDEDEDVAAGVWAGVLPLRLISDGVITAADAKGVIPTDVAKRALDFT